MSGTCKHIHFHTCAICTSVQTGMCTGTHAYELCTGVHRSQTRRCTCTYIHVHDARPAHTHNHTTRTHCTLRHTCLCMHVHTYLHTQRLHPPARMYATWIHRHTHTFVRACTHICSLINSYTCIKHVCLCTHAGMRTTLCTHTNTGMVHIHV